MSESRGRYVTTPTLYLAQLSPEQANWKAELLRKVDVLRAERKRAIIFITEEGTMLIFRAEPGGRIAP